jgi:hypothetical protein
VFLTRDNKLYADGPNLYLSYFAVSGLDPLGTEIVVDTQTEGDRTIEIIWVGNICFKRVRDKCGTIIETGTRVRCPRIPGTTTPWNEIPVETIVDVLPHIIEALPGIAEEVRTGGPLVHPLKPGMYWPVLDSLIRGAVSALDLFRQPNSKCKEWYVNAIRAIVRAHHGDCRGCSAIQRLPATIPTAADLCHEELVNQNLLQAAAGFDEFSIHLAKQCNDLCNANRRG